MKVNVNTFANLRDYAPDAKGHAELTLAEGATVGELIAALRIPPAVQTVILVNGRRADAATRLISGDEVTLFPPMEGG
jgi:molybdopterin converting factor small subunit